MVLILCVSVLCIKRPLHVFGETGTLSTVFRVKKELGSCYRVNQKVSEVFKVGCTNREKCVTHRYTRALAHVDNGRHDHAGRNGVVQALFTLYAPTEMCSTLVIDQPSINISQNLLWVLNWTFFEIKGSGSTYKMGKSPEKFWQLSNTLGIGISSDI